MKKIYSLLFVSLFLFIGYSCDDGSLSHSDVYIPDPVEETDEDDGFSAEPTTEAVIKVQFGRARTSDNRWLRMCLCRVVTSYMEQHDARRCSQ